MEGSPEPQEFEVYLHNALLGPWVVDGVTVAEIPSDGELR